MEIKLLDAKEYAGKKFTARYISHGYYDIHADGGGFRIEYVPFETPEERGFDDEFFGEWLDDPTAYGAFEDGRLIGFAEGCLEKWNNRFRLSNICVFDSASRAKGAGRALMAAMTEAAKASGARMIVLETQSCNTGAIDFYEKTDLKLSASICIHTQTPTPSGMKYVSKWERNLLEREKTGKLPAVRRYRENI